MWLHHDAESRSDSRKVWRINVYEIRVRPPSKLSHSYKPETYLGANRGPRKNLAILISQKPYRGINTFLLSASRYPSLAFWLTYDQATKLGGHVRQGEHSHLIVYWNIGEEKLNPKTGKLSKPFLLRSLRVFNLFLTEGISRKLGLTESAKPVSRYRGLRVDCCFDASRARDSDF